MSAELIQIARYPNRRFYARKESKYVSLQDIERLIREGKNVEIRDSQTDNDLTRAVLTRLIIDRQPDKMRLFPVDMLHFILRSNDVMADFLRDYFQHSLTYLSYLQRHRPTTTGLAQPMHWVKAWLDGITAKAAENGDAPEPESADAANAAVLANRVEQLEERIRQLEAK